MRARDTQRSKVYAAEREAFPDIYTPTMTTVGEAQAFVDTARAKRAVVNRFGRWRKDGEPVVVEKGRVRTTTKREAFRVAKITVEPGHGHRRATGGYGVIQLPRWARSEPVILHEMAHCLGGTGHDWRFCETYLTLVKAALGVEAHDRLRAAFKAHRVRYTKPRERRPVSPERRAQLIAQLERARAAKAEAA